MAELLEGVREPLGLSPDRLLIAFSHTHAGANLSSSLRDHPGGDKIRPYFERLIRLCAEAGAEAIANLTPAWLNFGSGTCDLAQNRDAWDEDSQQFVTGFNPDGEADDTVLVGRVSADDGSVLATLVNYGCHPTTLGPTNRLLSPDYIGAMREVMEDSVGAPCLFLLSPCGETGPREGFVGDTAVADSNGRRLGFAAAGAVESCYPRGRNSSTTAHHLRRHARRVEANHARSACRRPIIRAAQPHSAHRPADQAARIAGRPPGPTTKPPATWKPRKPPATPSPSATPPPSASAPGAASSADRPSPTAAPSPSTSTSGRSATPSSSPCPPSPTPCSRPSCDPVSPAIPSSFRRHQRHPRLPPPPRPLRQEPLPGLGLLPRLRRLGASPRGNQRLALGLDSGSLTPASHVQHLRPAPPGQAVPICAPGGIATSRHNSVRIAPSALTSFTNQHFTLQRTYHLPLRTLPDADTRPTRIDPQSLLALRSRHSRTNVPPIAKSPFIRGSFS